VHEVSRLAKQNLHEAQLRYKKAHYKERNMEIKDGDWVFVTKMVLERGLSPKLVIPVDGPFQVKKAFSDTYHIITVRGIATVSSDRVTTVPYPVDFSEPLRVSTRAVGACEENEVDDVTEWVIERVMSHGKLDDGTKVVKNRWLGYTEAEDTWEPAFKIPISFIQRYAKRRRLQLAEILQQQGACLQRQHLQAS
jgi:hypothetical protein